MERVQKIIANSGYCSRRKAEGLIEQGNVKINGQVAKLGDKATQEDKIMIEGKPLSLKKKNFYYILNKPKGILVTKDDPRNRRTIYNLKAVSKLGRELGVDLNYVGRLDGMSEGLLILTNDGDLNNMLTHPSHDVKKTYSIRIEPKLTNEDVKKLGVGIMIDERKFFGKVSNMKGNTFDITIGEGRNRIIRRVLEDVLEYKIYQLKRISVGNVKLGVLGSGEVRELSEGEVVGLKK